MRFVRSRARLQVASAVVHSLNYPGRRLLTFKLVGFLIHRLIWGLGQTKSYFLNNHKFETLELKLTSFHCNAVQMKKLIAAILLAHTTTDVYFDFIHTYLYSSFSALCFKSVSFLHHHLMEMEKEETVFG